MFNRKAKEMEEQLAQSQQEVTILAKKVETLTAALEEFKAKEAAISGALTSAQHAADKTIEEANTKSALIVEKAEQELIAAQTQAAETIDAANREADDIIEEATQKGEGIVAEAKERARTVTMQAEAFMAEYRQNAVRLNESLQAAAKAAAMQAEQFRSFASNKQLSDEIELAEEYADASTLLEDKPVDLPEDYDSPAELMKSIYTIQGRDLPEEEQEEAQPMEEAQEPETAEPAENEETAEESEKTEEQPEEKLWTVDEIMATPAEPISSEEVGLDNELDAIIDDVLNELYK